MPTPVSTTETWHFGIYEVDAGRMELRRNGSPIKLREQSFLVLIHLLEHAGEIVTREDLRQVLWPSDTFVEFDHSLSTAVMKLRDALGDSIGTPVYIETIPRRGYRFIAKVTVEERNSAAAGSNLAVLPAPALVALKPQSRKRLAWQLVAGLAAILLLARLAWIAFHPRTEPPAIVRFQIPAPDKLMFLPWETVAVSPDGQRIAFVAGTANDANDRLFVRSLNEPTATEIRVPGDAHSPFWSPDGRHIAFFQAMYGGAHPGVSIQKVESSGGPPVTICNITAGTIGSGTWNRDGVILYGSGKGMFRVSAGGGEAKLFRPLAPGEKAQVWPEFLPDGRHYVYLSLSDHPDQQGLYAASLDSNDRTFIVASATKAAYAQGQLLFTRGDALMAQPFDLRTLKLSGEPQPVAEHIEIGSGGAMSTFAIFAASANGVIAWRQALNTTQLSLQWLDRAGRKLDTVGGPGEYASAAISPDDGKLAVSVRDPMTKNFNIWIVDLRRSTRTRLTLDPANDASPAWSADGTRIAFTSDRSGQKGIYWKPADGSQPEQLLFGGKEQKGEANVEDWSRDGKYLVYNTGGGQGPAHIYVLPFADRKPVPFVEENYTSHESQISPNGRWIAYMSREEKQPEVVVERFDLDRSQPRSKWQISSLATGSGEMPRWRRDGKELYYHAGSRYFVVDVKTDGPTFEAGAPRLLFESVPFAGHGGRYVVTSDGQRFLEPEAIDKPAAIEVLANWR